MAEQYSSGRDYVSAVKIWPIDVAESYNVDVDAFDLSDQFIPPRSWLPRGVHFKTHDIRTPFAEEFIGKYDVVHFRLFLTASPSQVRQMLSTAFTLLKPGGHVQWTEHDKTNLTSVSAGAGSLDAVEAYIGVQRAAFEGHDPSWVRDIAPAMMNSGFQVMAEDSIAVRPSLLGQFHELHLLSLVDIAPGLSKKVDEFKEMYFDALVQDHKRGVAIVDGFICVVGRKLGPADVHGVKG